METAIRDEIISRLDRLPTGPQRRALEFIRGLETPQVKGTPGRELRDLAGTLSAADAAQMLRVIDEAFERVDPDAW